MRRVGAATALLVVVGCGPTVAPVETARQARSSSIDPDFVVEGLDAPSSFTDWAGFQARARVCNRGGTGASPGDVQLVFSQDASADPGDFFSGMSWAPHLSPGQCQWVDLWGTAPGGPPTAWFLIAVADPNGVVLEGDETNNARAEGPLGVGYGPDLVVSSLSTPPVADSGFEAGFEVCNRGTQGSSGTDVAFYASADATIQPITGPNPDFMLGVGWVDGLQPGECRAGVANLWAGPWGELYVGAVVDQFGGQPELVPANNTLVGGVMGFGSGPDLIISALQAPPNVDGAFEAQVTVCNQGNAPGGGTEVGFFASLDSSLEAPPAPNPDFPLGMVPVPYLSAGQCQTQTASLWAGPQGAFHLLAKVDPWGSITELLESNNLRDGGLMGFGYGPDLVVSAISAPPSAQGSFEASVTACNQGTAPSNSFDLTLYLSEDEEITSAFPSPGPDFPAGWAYFNGLVPGQCATQVVPSNAWMQGAFHIGAVVDEGQAVQELLEGNNAFTGPLMGLGVGPDLVVTAIQGPPSANGGFNVDVTACNQGTASSSGGDVTVYLSLDAHVASAMPPGPGTDLPIAWLPLPSLQPGQCHHASGMAYGGPQGAYYLGAVVDEYDSVPELIESNNTFVGARMGLGYGPDLIVTAVEGPASADGSFTVAVTACNQGTAHSGGSDVMVYVSADTTITPASGQPFLVDFPVGGMPIPGLAPGQCYTGTVNAWTPAPGALYLGAYVDEYNGQAELLEDNNAFVGALTGFGWGSDLVVTNVVAPANANGPFDVTVTACNQGTAPSGSFPVEVYASADAVITPLQGQQFLVDWPLAGLYFPGLQAGQCASQSTSAYPPLNGAFYLGAYADGPEGEPELIESNNAFTGALMGFGPGPDLVVTNISAPPSANGPFAVTVRVCNQGTTSVSGADVSVFASADAELESGLPPPAGDLLLTSVWVSSLQAGACADVAGSASSGPTGAYYLGAVADEFDAVEELQEGNNAFLGGLIGFGPGPDLVVTNISAPPSANGPFAVTITVCNQGTTASSGSDVTLYASADTVITSQFNLQYPSPDLAMGGASVPGIAPGQCANPTLTAYPGPAGAVYLGAVVDEFQGLPELIESNNVTVGGLIGLGYGPDLVAGAVALPPYALPGGQLSVAVEVCNQGTAQSPSVDAFLVASEDETLTVSGPNPDFIIGSVFVPSLAPGLCQPAVVAGWAPSPLGEYAVGLVVDPFQSVQELIESNNAEIAGTLEVATVFCGNGVVEGLEWCDDGNFTDNDGCDTQCRVEQRPWKQLATGTQVLNIGWQYAMGYNFTPLSNGHITALGGVFNGTKTVRLYNRSTGQLLAQTQVTGNNTWRYGAVAPVPVSAGQTYTVAVYLAGSGGSYRTGVGSYPKVAQDIRITGTTYVYTASNPTARPTNNYTGTVMYGQADVMFVRSTP
jgi:cysteine-rich repeat protein